MYRYYFGSSELAELVHSSQRSTKSQLKSHLKSQFLPEIALLRSQQNFHSCLKSCSLPYQIYASKSFQDDWSQVNPLMHNIPKCIKGLTIGRPLLIGIYWYQSTNRSLCIVIYTSSWWWFDHKSYGQTTLMRMSK